jgi:hypothetical protein
VSRGELWRVGHRSDPLAYTPYELCSWNHRFDDRERRFRTVYCAEHPETSLREVLADLRPNLAAREAFADAFGVEALEDLPACSWSLASSTSTSTRSPRGVGW